MPAGRPQKPLKVLQMSGATRKNPQRYRGRKAAASVGLSSGLGPPPAAWEPHPRRAEAAALFAAGHDAHFVAQSIGISWELAKSMRPGADPTRESQLLALWHEVIAQDVIGVLNVSHRLLVENTCHLMYRIRRASMGCGKATSGDYAQVKSNLAAMGMTPADSPRVAEAVRVPDRDGSASRVARAAGGWGELAG